jgi:hypothetical protein
MLGGEWDMKLHMVQGTLVCNPKGLVGIQRPQYPPSFAAQDQNRINLMVALGPTSRIVVHIQFTYLR